MKAIERLQDHDMALLIRCKAHLRCWSRWAHALLLFTSAQNKSKANLGWLPTASVWREGDPIVGGLVHAFCFLHLTTVFSVIFRIALFVSFSRVFVCTPWGQCDSVWKEFCFHQKWLRTERDVSASSWKWNTIIVFSPDSPATRSRRNIGSGGESSSMLTSVVGNAVQAFCTRKNASKWNWDICSHWKQTND
jgi:hypothetical protein